MSQTYPTFLHLIDRPFFPTCTASQSLLEEEVEDDEPTEVYVPGINDPPGERSENAPRAGLSKKP